MAITQAICTQFKSDLLLGVHVFGTDTLKLALYTSSATLDSSTTAYTATGEASGSGYTAGGKDLAVTGPSISGTKAIVDFNDLVWTSATITARGAMIYNSSKSNKAIMILDFGSDKSSTAGDFTIVFPPYDATNAILRIA